VVSRSLRLRAHHHVGIGDQLQQVLHAQIELGLAARSCFDWLKSSISARFLISRRGSSGESARLFETWSGRWRCRRSCGWALIELKANDTDTVNKERGKSFSAYSFEVRVLARKLLKFLAILPVVLCLVLELSEQQSDIHVA